MSARKRRSAPIERNLECPVCFEDYSHTIKLPKFLLCGHTACADCLDKIMFGNDIQCPICRKNHASKGSVNDLPTNYSILSMVDSTCQDCRNAPKTNQCLPGHCNQELCDLCRERHLQAFYSYQQAFNALQAEISKLEASCSDSDSLKRMIDKQNKVTEQVNNTCDSLMEKIEKIRTKTIPEVEAKVDTFIQWQKNLRKSLDEGKKIVQQSEKLSSMNEDLHTKCESLRKELGEKSHQMSSLIDCSLDASLSDITTLLMMLPDHLDKSYSAVTQAIASLNRERSPVKPLISIDDYRSFTGIEIYKARTPWEISASQSGGVIAFTDGRALHIISDQFEALASYSGEASTAGEMGVTWGTVISRDNKIFVSDRDGHNIHVANLRGRHLYQIGSEGGGQGQFKDPRGLAMDEDDTLFVCDSKNHRISCFTPDGAFIRQFGCKGDREGHFKSEPWYIAASRPHDIAAISDIDGNLYIFSHGGVHYRTIRARTTPYNMFACGVAIDAAGCIIVADDGGGQLLVLDDHLHVVARIGSKENGPGQLRGQRGVTLTARGEVLVCDYWNNRIQIFSKNHI